MSRIIKFRGKRISNGKWVYGDLLSNVSTCVSREIIKVVAIKDTVSHINDGFIDLIPSFVHSETVGQWTGLVDKNGVEIFEGDVGSSEDDVELAVIVYNELECQFVADYVDGYEPQILGEWFVVKGNIHQHPELLEAKC